MEMFEGMTLEEGKERRKGGGGGRRQELEGEG